MPNLSKALVIQLLGLINGKFSEGSASAPFLRIYQGTQPANPDALPSSMMLVEMQLPNAPFSAPSAPGNAAEAAANVSLIPEATIATTGEAQWFRAFNRDGVPFLDGTVTDGSGNGDLKLQQTSLIAGRKVKINSWITRYPQ